ncbi:Protein of unknown function [Soonwooa buanensis]|uniref:Mu-like prophage protein gp36 n=1 Tax=Soonwooa buanensis TaxID=619805 RepID=A0A1T5CW48_9FLAO|nr:DUF1320 family protein [Soonwooa buanensis]SKB63652.1 Protein of unknown function [Soonwooa buanensis]
MSQYITVAELKTHAYDEEIEAIIRSDETIAIAAIDMAIEYAESFLAKIYDTETIFAKVGDQRSTLLVEFIKDIAMWKLIGLANPSIDYEDKEKRFNMANSWLKSVYKGMPANLPKKELEPNKSTSFSFKSNPKRENRY